MHNTQNQAYPLSSRDGYITVCLHGYAPKVGCQKCDIIVKNCSFSIDMNALWAIEGISHREIMSIERIRCMYCFVRRTLTTKSERIFFNNTSDFLHPTRMDVTKIDEK